MQESRFGEEQIIGLLNERQVGIAAADMQIPSNAAQASCMPQQPEIAADDRPG